MTPQPNTMHQPTETLHHLRPSDIDSFGHVNHSKSIELLELGRYDWLMKHKLPLDERWTPVVTRITVAYRREIFLAEVTIRTTLTHMKQYSAEFEQAIHIPGLDEPAVSGCICVSFVNRGNGRPMRLRDIEGLSNGDFS